MSATMKQHNHLARIDTHRVQLMDLDADEYGAPEGGRLPEAEPSVFTFTNCYFAVEDAPRGEPAPRIPRERKASSLIGPVMGVAVVVLVALGSCVAQVAK